VEWTEETLLSIYLVVDSPPPPALVGDVTSPHLYCGVTATQDRWLHLEASLAFSIHTEGLRDKNIFRLPSAKPLAFGGMDLWCGGDIVSYFFTPD
jgi:hypothetical protein